MIRVLHFVSVPAVWSGIMSVIMNYYRHMDRSRIQFDFLCFLHCQESYEDEIRELGGRVFFVSRPGISPGSRRELKEFFLEHGREYAWMHNHEVYLSFLLKPLAGENGISRFIVHSHATRYSDRKFAAVRNRILCIPIKWMKCHKFACSREAGEFLFGAGAVKAGKVTILNNAIDVETFRFCPEIRQEIREELGLSDRFVIGHIGRFVPQKNQEFLLDVFAKAVKKRPDLSLLFIGDGPSKKAVEEKSRALGLNEKNVRFLGQRTDVPRLLNAMDVFALPSLFEGIGVVLMEAQANGLFCLASDQVPREAKITETVKFLPLDSESWIREFCGASHSRNHTQREALSIRENFQKRGFDIQQETRKLEDYYENTDPSVDV